jgi:hypothetical protein
MHLKNTREQAIREKEQKRGERVELKRQNLTEQDEANARKVADKDAASCLKQQRASERALQQTRKAAEREQAACKKAASTAAARVVRAAQKAEWLAQRHRQSQSRNSQVVEMAEGREGKLDVGRASPTTPSMSEFSFALPSSPFHPYPQVRTASMPSPLQQPQFQSPFYYTSPTPMSSSMPQSQRPFRQFHVPLQSTLPTMQFPIGFQIPMHPHEYPYLWSTQNLNEQGCESEFKCPLKTPVQVGPPHGRGPRTMQFRCTLFLEQSIQGHGYGFSPCCSSEKLLTSTSSH